MGKRLTQKERLQRIEDKTEFDLFRDTAGMYLSQDCENGRFLVCDYGGYSQEDWDQYGKTDMGCQLYLSSKDFGTNRMLFSVQLGNPLSTLRQEVSFLKEAKKLGCKRHFNIVKNVYKF